MFSACAGLRLLRWRSLFCLEAATMEYPSIMARRRKKTSTAVDRLLMGDDGWVPKTAHSETADGRKTLTVRFDVPREWYKGSNTRDNDRVSSRKSAWLRAHAEEAWLTALSTEWGITPIEPADDSWEKTDKSKLTPSEQDARDRLDSQQAIVDSLGEDLDSLDARIAAAKAKAAAAKRGSAEYAEAMDARRALEDEAKALRQRKRLESKLLTRCKHRWEAVHSKQESRRSSVDRKAYLEAKASANLLAGKMLFPGKARLTIRCCVPTAHVFDAPNCWPTVKPLQDGGTDSCALWRDDNNEIIESTTFVGGGKSDNGAYVIEFIIEEV